MSKAGFVLPGVYIPNQHSCIETAEPQSSGADCSSTLEKPLKSPRVFPTPVIDVHVVVK